MHKNDAADYRVEQATTGATALLRHPRYGRQVWVRCRVRKICRCAISGRGIAAGASAYRPITNQRNRQERISEYVIQDSFHENHL